MDQFSLVFSFYVEKEKCTNKGRMAAILMKFQISFDSYNNKKKSCQYKIDIPFQSFFQPFLNLTAFIKYWEEVITR